LSCWCVRGRPLLRWARRNGKPHRPTAAHARVLVVFVLLVLLAFVINRSSQSKLSMDAAVKVLTAVPGAYRYSSWRLFWPVVASAGAAVAAVAAAAAAAAPPDDDCEDGDDDHDDRDDHDYCHDHDAMCWWPLAGSSPAGKALARRLVDNCWTASTPSATSSPRRESR
jgi:hypothetical protein